MRLVLECARDASGRLTGELSGEGGPGRRFCGTLELLRALDDHFPRRDERVERNGRRLSTTQEEAGEL